MKDAGRKAELRCVWKIPVVQWARNNDIFAVREKKKPKISLNALSTSWPNIRPSALSTQRTVTEKVLKRHIAELRFQHLRFWETSTSMSKLKLERSQPTLTTSWCSWTGPCWFLDQSVRDLRSKHPGRSFELSTKKVCTPLVSSMKVHFACSVLCAFWLDERNGYKGGTFFSLVGCNGIACNNACKKGRDPMTAWSKGGSRQGSCIQNSLVVVEIDLTFENGLGIFILGSGLSGIRMSTDRTSERQQEQQS